jgi:hypothetical protein
MAEHPHLRVFRHTITMRLAFVRWNSSNEIDFAGCAREPMREPPPTDDLDTIEVSELMKSTPSRPSWSLRSGR